VLSTEKASPEPDRRWRIYTSLGNVTIDLVGTASEIDDALERATTNGTWLHLPGGGQRLNPRHIVAIDPLD
jgi:hypothetical protein